MPAPESRSVFEAAQDRVLLHGLTLVTGAAADGWAAEPAPVSHGAWGSARAAGAGGIWPSSCLPAPSHEGGALCPTQLGWPPWSLATGVAWRVGKWAFLRGTPVSPKLLLQPQGSLGD